MEAVAVPPTVTVPEADPVAVGAKATLIPHEAPTARVEPQLGRLAAKPVLTRIKVPAIPVMVMPLSGELPVFFTVRSCVALVVPTVSLPKLTELGVMLAV